MGVYQDQRLAQQTLQQLRQLYPSADILTCSDGINDQSFVSFCRERGIRHLIGERLKIAHYGGAWILRMLLTFLSYSHAGILIKIDPDVRIHRTFNTCPQGDLIGNIRPCRGGAYIQGGCFGITRGAASRIVDSFILDDLMYQSEPFNYLPSTAAYGNSSKDRLIASDLIISHASQRLGMSWGEWGEICSHATAARLALDLISLTPEQITAQYAVIHPVKEA